MLDGYEARRSIRLGDRTIPVSVWIRVVNGQGGRNFALAKLLPDPAAVGEALRRPEGTTAEAVVGSTDAHLTVDRVSTDVTALLDHRATDVVGQSLFRLVDAPDVRPLLMALARGARRSRSGPIGEPGGRAGPHPFPSGVAEHMGEPR